MHSTPSQFTTPVVQLERRFGEIPSPGEILQILKNQGGSPGKLNEIKIRFIYERNNENFDALCKALQELSSLVCSDGLPGTISAAISSLSLTRLTSIQIDIFEVNVPYICH